MVGVHNGGKGKYGVDIFGELYGATWMNITGFTEISIFTNSFANAVNFGVDGAILGFLLDIALG
ncbi:MAG: hypothetical protein ACHQJ6_08725 [Candidatus Berkiellales bacterium]